MNKEIDWDHIEGFPVKLLLQAIVNDFTMQSLDQALQTDLTRGPLATHASPLLEFPSQVFELIKKAKREGWVRELVTGLAAANRGGPGLRHFRDTAGLTFAAAAPAAAGWRLEDVLRPDADFLKPDGWLDTLAALRRQVCRIEYRSRPADKPGFGTGWLIAPDVILTNFHVISKFKPLMANGLDVADVVCRFDVPEPPSVSQGRAVRLAADWLVQSSRPGEAERGEGTAAPAADELDFAALRLAEPVGNEVVEPQVSRGWVDLARRGPMPSAGDVLLIIQHPEGLPQRLAFGNALGPIKLGDLRLKHDANTLPGSSGSPVVNVKLDVVALHHAGGLSNQAVPIGPVAACLGAAGIAI